MKQIRKFVLFICILSMMLMSWASADPIDTIIGISPDSNSFSSSLVSSSGSVTVNEENYEEAPGGWIMDIFNSLLGIISGGLLYPLFAVLGIDHIPKLIFNKEPLTRLTFFDSAGTGMANGLMNIIAPLYVAFRYIAIICFIAIILYLAIRMLLSTVGKQKAMYKELIKHWFSGVIILLTFNWLMTYTIVLSDTLVEVLATAIGYDSSTPSYLSDSIGSFGTVISMGILSGIYMLCLFGITIAVWWTYIKRLFTVGLLIMLFPLVTITYVFDKIGDRKSQILNSWIREYMTNVFIQPIQALALILIMAVFKSTDATLTTQLLGPIIKLIMLFMLFPAEKLLKKIFDVNPGINGGGMAGAGAGVVGGMMMASKAAPILSNNIRNFRNASKANTVYANAKRDFAKGKIDATKLAEAKKNAVASRGRTLEAITGTAGTAFGAGLTGNIGHAMAIGAAADKMTGWGADKIGTGAAKKEINSTYDGLQSAIDSGNLSDSQKKSIANRLGISTAELDRTLANEGGKDLLKRQLDSEKMAALAHLKLGADGATFERNKFNDSMSIDAASGNFMKLGADGNKIADGKLGKLRMSRNNLTALDENGNIRMNLLDSNGKAYKHGDFSDDKEVDYGYMISGTSEIDLESNGMMDTAKANARKKALEVSSASIESKARAETLKAARDSGMSFKDTDAEEAYLNTQAGQQAYQSQYETAIVSSGAYQKQITKEIEKQETIVKELREATGIQTLQVTSISTPAPAPAPAPVPAAPAAGGTIPQAAPVAAAPVNTDELVNALSSAFKTSMTSAMTTATSAMTSELKSVMDQVANTMKTVTPGSTSSINLEGAIRNELQGVSDELARSLQNAANNYTTAVNDAQQSAANYLQQFGATTKSNDSHTDLQIRYSEEAAKVIERSRESRRKAGLDAI